MKVRLYAVDGTAPVVGAGITWLREFVPAFAEVVGEHRVVLFLREDMRALQLPLPANCTPVYVAFPPRGRGVLRIAWQQLVLPRELARRGVDVLIAPYDMAPLRAPCPTVMCIMNANPYDGPPAHTFLGRRREDFLRWITPRSAAAASTVFFVSDWSRRLISSKIGLPLEKTAVIPYGVGSLFAPADSPPPAERPYVLVVGSIRVHKDLLTVVRAWREVAGMPERPELRLVGPVLEPSYYERLVALIDELGIGQSVRFVRTVDHAELLRLYHGAAAMILPSFVETFGMPLAEAMAAGVPVIASDLPVTREVCADAALYYRLEDPASLASQLQAVLSDAETARQMRAAGLERARGFDWRLAAESVAGLCSRSLVAA